MRFDPDEIGQKATYKLISGAVIPRPIEWISSISETEERNLAPFSFFNVISDDPPCVMFSTVRTGDKNKDTLNNVLATKQFVVNLVTEETVEKMNKTSETLAADVDEFDYAELTAIASEKVRPPRVGESPVSFECELVHHFSPDGSLNGGAVMLVGKVVLFHFDERVLSDDFKINMENFKPVARLAGSNYAKLGEVFSIKRI